jgi:hypothetical protein
MRPDGPDRGRWCEEHHRWECVHNKHGGTPCHQPRIRGLDSCRIHVGSKGRKFAAQAVALREAGHWAPIETHPAEALLQEVYYWTGLCAWLDSIVASLERGEMVWGIVRRQVSSGAEGAEERAEWAAGVNAWIGWQERSHISKARVARMALEVVAEDRLLRLAESQGLAIFTTYQESLEALDLTPRQWERARAEFPRMMARLAGQEAA